MERLLENYHRVLQERLDLWLGRGAAVERSGTVFCVVWREQTLRLEFLPEQCQWLLGRPEDGRQASFDRITKRVRQLLSESSGGELS